MLVKGAPDHTCSPQAGHTRKIFLYPLRPSDDMGRRQAIIWTNAEILLIAPLGTNLSEISSEIQTYSFKKMHLKMSSGKWRKFCLGPNLIKGDCLNAVRFLWWSAFRGIFYRGSHGWCIWKASWIAKLMGPTWGPPAWVLSAPDGLHVGPMNLAIRLTLCLREWWHHDREMLSTSPGLCEGNHRTSGIPLTKGL